jgi:hypothetical protein
MTSSWTRLADAMLAATLLLATACGSSAGTGGSGGASGGKGGTAASGGTTGSGGLTGSGGNGTGGATSSGGATGSGGSTASGGAGGTGGATGSGGSAGAAGTCPGSCAAASVGSCSSPQVRTTSVNIGGALAYSQDETLAVPLAIAAEPGGGSRLAWVTSYAKYGSSTTSVVHVGELDCSDQLTGTPFTFAGHDFQDLAADGNGGVVVLTRDGMGGPDAQHCGDVNNLCSLPSDRPGCYDTYMVRYDCVGQEQWATKLTNSTTANPGYANPAGSNGSTEFVWWYQHHGRIASDGTNYAAYFCDAITVTNNTSSCAGGAGKIDIHEGDRMQVVGPTGSVLTGHDSFGIGCSHSWTTRMVWDPRTSHFVMVCATDNNCRIAQPNGYHTVATGTCDGTLFGGDIVLAGDTGYWTAWSQGMVIKLEHFSGTSPSDKTVTTAGNTEHPHLVSLGSGKMLLTWGSGSGQAAQIYDSTTGATVGAQFTIAAPDHPWQSWKAFPDGSVAWAGVASASSTITVARVMPCN